MGGGPNEGGVDRPKGWLLPWQILHHRQGAFVQAAREEIGNGVEVRGASGRLSVGHAKTIEQSGQGATDKSGSWPTERKTHKTYEAKPRTLPMAGSVAARGLRACLPTLREAIVCSGGWLPPTGGRVWTARQPPLHIGITRSVLNMSKIEHKRAIAELMAELALRDARGVVSLDGRRACEFPSAVAEWLVVLSAVSGIMS